VDLVMDHEVLVSPETVSGCGVEHAWYCCWGLKAGRSLHSTSRGWIGMGLGQGRLTQMGTYCG
jgi:hypothetical protein